MMEASVDIPDIGYVAWLCFPDAAHGRRGGNARGPWCGTQMLALLGIMGSFIPGRRYTTYDTRGTPRGPRDRSYCMSVVKPAGTMNLPPLGSKNYFV